MEERHRAIEVAAQHVQHTKRLLAQAGIACPRVTGRSGTFMLEVEAGVWDEIQPGSYAFMDADYARNEWAAPLPRFEHALFVLATVMSRPSAGVAIVDAGLKASSVDSGMPGVGNGKSSNTPTRPTSTDGSKAILARRSARSCSSCPGTATRRSTSTTGTFVSAMVS